MARFWFFTVCFAASFPDTKPDVIRADPQSHRGAGVFMLIEGGRYTLNFTSARAACLSLNVTIATRDQMEGAVRRGLETCKFGWIVEQVAVIPRISSDGNCGKGKTGVVQWSASLDTKFAVYCFNASDLGETPTTSKATAQTSTSPTTPTELTRSQTRPRTPTTPLTAFSRKKTTTEPPEQTSAFTVLVETRRSAGVSSSSTSAARETFSTRVPTPRPHFTASKPAVLTSAASASVSVPPQSKSAAKPSLGVVPTALVVLAVILLLLTAAGAVLYYKLNIFTCRSAGRQRDHTETEMWKHADSEADLHSQRGAEEEDDYEESDRKYSSDITLCENPDFKTNPSE